MAFTLVLPNGKELSSGVEPYCMTDRDARAAARRGPGQAAAAAAHAEAEALAQQLVANATPELLARATGVPAIGAEAEERYRLLADAARQAQGRSLTRDPLTLLLRRGSLPAVSYRAGQEIGRVFHAIAAGITPRTVASYGERTASGPAMEDWPPSLRTAYRDRYVPWRGWAGTQPVRQRGSRETLGDLTLLVAGEGHCPKAVAILLRMHQRTVLERLQHSLWHYALQAGWVEIGPEAGVAPAMQFG